MYADVTRILGPENIYVSEALARAYKLHIRDFFFLLSVHLGVLLPLPQQFPPKKAGYAGQNCELSIVQSLWR